MKTFHLLLCSGLLLSGPAQSAVISVNPSSAPSFTLDIDGDGISEISNIGLDADDSSGFSITVDVLSAISVFPNEPFVGIAGERSPSLNGLLASSILSGEYVAPNVIDRTSNDVTGVAFLLPNEPITGLWMYGTSGSNGEPIHLVGVVADFTAFYTSAGIDDITIYYNDYGAFTSGQSSGSISLLTTGIPEPSSLVLILIGSVGFLIRFRK